MKHKNNAGHPGEVSEELEELRGLAMEFLTKYFGTKLEAEKRIRTAALALNIVENLYRRGLLNDDKTPLTSEEGSTG